MEWLLFTYWLPPEPSRKRVFLWRRLKKVGALSVEGGVWLLPKTDALVSKVGEIAHIAEEMGGTVNVYVARHFTPAQEQRAIAQFRASREREYAEVVKECHKVLQHIQRETEEQEFTFEEVEELESEQDKIGRWFSEVRERDFWGAPGRQEVEQLTAEIELAMAAFTQKTYDKLQNG